MAFFRTSTAIGLCVAQLSLGFISSGALASTPSPEFTLLENVVALQAQDLPQQEVENRLNTLLTGYTSTANPEGRGERLQQAMVNLGVYTPAQAAAFIQEVKQTASSGADVNTALGELLSTPADGAQFSWCALGGGLLIGASAFVLLLGYALSGIGDSGGSTASNDRVYIIGGSGMAVGVTLVVVGAAGHC